MNLVIYNRTSTKINTYAETLYLRIAMMYAHEVSISSFISMMLITWHLKHTLSEWYFCKMHDLFFLKKADEKVENCMLLHDELKKIRKVKHKNKEWIIYQQKTEQLMEIIKNDVLTYFDNFMNAYKLIAPVKFCEEAENACKKTKSEEVDCVLILLSCKEYTKETEGEDPLIKNIIDGFLELELNLILDAVIEELVPFTRLNGEENMSESFFFSTLLFEFPFLCDLNYDQLKNVRDELKPIVKPFHVDYEKFQKELALVPFENSQSQVLLLFNSIIVPHLEKIQKKIDENIYVQQQKNRYETAQHIKVMIGITSVENQIQLLEKEEIILPYVTEAIIEKLEKNRNIKSCMPFIYHKHPTKVSNL